MAQCTVNVKVVWAWERGTGVCSKIELQEGCLLERGEGGGVRERERGIGGLKTI